MDLIVRVKEIKGTCSVYKLGDTFKLKDGYRLVSEIPLCMHSLAALGGGPKRLDNVSISNEL